MCVVFLLSKLIASYRYIHFLLFSMENSASYLFTRSPTYYIYKLLDKQTLRFQWPSIAAPYPKSNGSKIMMKYYPDCKKVSFHCRQEYQEQKRIIMDCFKWRMIENKFEPIFSQCSPILFPLPKKYWSPSIYFLLCFTSEKYCWIHKISVYLNQ